MVFIFLLLSSFNSSLSTVILNYSHLESNVGDEVDPTIDLEPKVKPVLYPNNKNPIKNKQINSKSKNDIISINPLDTFSPLKQTRNSRYESHIITQEEVLTLKEKVGVRDSNKNYNTIVEGHGTGLAPPTNSEWAAMIDKLEVVTGTENVELPESIDHSQSSYFPKVGNQLTQGSCAAWATNYYMNGYLQAKDNKWLSAKTGNSKQLMSPAWTYNKANSGSDSGSSAFMNHITLETIGSSTLSTMPYNPSDFVSFGNESAWREAPKYRANGLRQTDPENIDIIKSWIADGYLCYMGIDSNEFPNGLGSSDDIITSIEYSSSVSNHATTIVGYDDKRVADDDIGAFKIVNSWGSSWGNSWGGSGNNGGWSGNGFYWLTYEALAELISPVYSFFDKVDYDPKLIATWEFSGSCSRDAEFLLGIGSVSSPIDSKKPEWNQGDKHNLPKFMCCDMTEFVDSAGFESFFLDIGTSVNRTSISSFKLEYYGDGFSINNYTNITKESPDVPKSTPGFVTIRIYGLQVKIIIPNDNQYYKGEIQSKGTTNSSINETIIHEDFENEFPGDWIVGDSNSSYGEDYWGNTSYRSKSGSWSGYCSGVSEPIFEEDFDTGGSIPTGWTTYSENVTSNWEWEVVNSGYNYVYSGSDYAAVTDSDDAGPGSNITEWLYMTTSFNASQYSNLSLEFLLLFVEYDGDEYAEVLYSNGSTYPTFSELKKWTNTTFGKQKLDLSSAAGENDVYLAFRYHGTYDYYMLVDDVRVTDNSSSDEYDNSMISYMYQSVSLSSYDYVNLSYDYWLDSETDFDFLMIIYYVNGWFYVDLHNGSSSGWKSSYYLIPTSATNIGFLFQSDDSISSYEGAYIDNVNLQGYKNFTKLEMRMDLGNWKTPNGTSNWNYTINTSKYSDGKHNISIRGKYGSKFAYDLIDVYFDNTSPNSFTPTANPSSWTSNTQPVITFATSDATSGIDYYDLKIDNGNFNPQSSPYTLPFQNDGTHIIYVRAYDNMGNYIDNSVNVYIDTNNPIAFTPIATPDTWTSNTQPEVSFSTTDATSGIDHYEVKIDTGSFSIQNSPFTLPTLSDGIHTITVRAFDMAGNYIEGIVNVYIDSTSPNIFYPFANPSKWTTNDQPVITFSAHDSITDIDHYKVKIDNDAFTTESSPYKLPKLDDGIRNITVRAFDVAGNYFDGYVNVYIDTNSPNSFNPNATPNTWTNTQPIITFSTSDQTSGIDRYEIKIDSGNYSVFESPYTLPILDDGTHVILIRAYDLADNYYEASVKVYIDKSKPNEFSPTVDPSGWISNQNPTLYFHTIDSVTDIDYYKVRVDSGEFTEQRSPYVLPNLIDGEHLITIRAFDTAGNYRDGSVEVRIDTISPTIEITNPKDDQWIADSELEITWTCTDSGSGIKDITLRLNNGPITSAGLGNSHKFSYLQEGNYTIRITVYDNAFNQITEQITFHVDQNPPSILISSPKPNEFLSDSDVDINWTGVDDGSRIDYYKIKIDNGKYKYSDGDGFHTFNGLTDGWHTVVVKAFDMAANQDLSFIEFYIDTKKPIISIIEPKANSKLKTPIIKCSWSSSDGGSNIDHYEIKLDQDEYIKLDKETEYTFEDVKAGPHKLFLKAYDEVGNFDEVSVSFDVEVHDLTDQDSDINEKGSQNLGLIIGVFVIIIVIFLIILIFLFLKKKKPQKRPPPIRQHNTKSTYQRRSQQVLEPEIVHQPINRSRRKNLQEYIPPQSFLEPDRNQRRKYSRKVQEDIDYDGLDNVNDVDWDD
jgi:hypothetical protein